MICFGKQLVYNNKEKTRENCKDSSCPAFDPRTNGCILAATKKEGKGNDRTAKTGRK